MKIPLRPSRLTVRQKRPKWVIIHHTSELYDNPASRIDNPKYQMPGLYSGVLEKKHADINYHYVIDQIKEDFEVINCRPFVYMCDWDDISADINKRAIHVALMGNYDFKLPVKRCYEILAYRLLNPMMKMYGMSPNKIKMHRDVSDDKEITCPGEFVDPTIIDAMVRKFVIK